jgi:hypothetical protein
VKNIVKRILFSLSLSSLIITTISYAEKAPFNSFSKQQTIEAKGKIKGFSNELKNTLKANIKQGGLTQGIEVCKNMANSIAQKHSTDGWQIKRTSLKLRNAKNTPDTWEIEQLNKFVQQKSNGKNINELIATTTSEDGDFRLIKAIPMGEVCLKCHGKRISPEVKSSLRKHYPKDLATDFMLGDIRGAFSIIKKAKIQ